MPNPNTTNIPNILLSENQYLFYPKFFPALITNEPLEQPKRFKVMYGLGVVLHSAYHTKDIFYLPAHLINEDDDFSAARKAKITMILATCCFQQKTRCWYWAGARSGQYPSVYYMGKLLGALKVLVALLTEESPTSFQTKRMCKNSLCINPAHHQFIGFNYNIPRDPLLQHELYGMPIEENYWTYPEVLPWQNKLTGISTLTKEEMAALPSVVHSVHTHMAKRKVSKEEKAPIIEKQKIIEKQTSDELTAMQAAETAAAAQRVIELDAQLKHIPTKEEFMNFFQPPIPIVETSPTEWIKDYNTVEKLQKLLPFLDDEEEIKLATQQLEILQMQELETKAKKKSASKEKTIKT